MSDDSDAEARERRKRALASLESVTFHAGTPGDRLRQRLTSPTFAMTGKMAEEVAFGGLDAGALTPEIISAGFDELWNRRVPVLAGAGITVTGTLCPDAAEQFLELFRPRCGAVLFPLPRPAGVVMMTYSSWFSWERSGRPPVQGPQPAVCSREPHPSPWHHDGHGTWWR